MDKFQTFYFIGTWMRVVTRTLQRLSVGERPGALCEERRMRLEQIFVHVENQASGYIHESEAACVILSTAHLGCIIFLPTLFSDAIPFVVLPSFDRTPSFTSYSSV